MFNNIASSGLSLGKVMSGISKTLSIVNQVLPLYKEMKPVLGNAKTILNAIKEISPQKNINSKLEVEKNNIKKDTSLQESIYPNNFPVFFN